MDPEFGIGIERYLFENDTLQLKSEIDTKIKQQSGKYLPFIRVNNTILTGANTGNILDGNTLFIQIKYYILPISEEDILNIELPLPNIDEDVSSQSLA